MMTLAFLYRRNQRTYSYSYSTKVRAFVNLNERIHTPLRAHNFVNLIGGNRIKSTAKTCKLKHFKIRHFAYKSCGTVQAVMVYPLVNNAERTFNASELRNAVFSKYGKTECIYHFRNSVIYLWIKMIRTTGKDNSVSACTNHRFKSFFSGFLYVFAEFFLLVPCIFNSFFYLLFRKRREFRKHLFTQTLRKTFLIINRKERIHIKNVFVLPEFINIIPQNFRIACYNRTVIVISCAGIFLFFIRSTRIENKFYSLLKKRNKVTVTYFSRIAHRFRRDSFNSFFINAS